MRAVALLAAGLAVAVSIPATAAPTDLAKALADAKYVYIQSQRKSGELGAPAEIWFYADGTTVYVGTRPTSWRVRRIKAGRPKAHIAVGKPDGPAFDAVGEIVHDSALEQRMMDAYAKKYPDRWPSYADAFRDGFKSGDRVLVRYRPKH
jgi:hypothetical protein